MNAPLGFGSSAAAVLSVAALFAAGCAGMPLEHRVKVELHGSEEVPLVVTSARGGGTITVAADKSVSGSVTTTGMNAVAAHIHQGARGQNGPILIGLVKGSENVWSVPAGAKLGDGQYETFKAGNLYVNVHSPAHKDGEIRGQMNP